MRVLSFMGKKRIELESGNWMELEYYLSEEDELETNETHYGMSVVEMKDELTITESIRAVSQSKEVVADMLKDLITHTVTPISLVEIVDEMVTTRMCS